MENHPEQNGKIFNAAENGRLVITYYTDPLCSWSWAFQPVWERLLTDYGQDIDFRYCMGGMLSSWNEYNDVLRSVSRQLQMAPVWAEVKHVTGEYLDDKIWFNDPPASSYPACLAMKCAERQSQLAGHLYLQKLRKAVMTEQRNIARKEVLIAVAKETALELPGFDIMLFIRQLADPLVLMAFKDDLREVRMNSIVRFPSLMISNVQAARKLMLTGYRPYEALMESIGRLTAKQSLQSPINT